MANRKNQLAQNIPDHSSLNDIEREPDVCSEFLVEFEDGTQPEKVEKKWDLPIGRQKVRAVGYEKFDAPRFFTTKKGMQYKIDPCYEIEVENIQTGDRTKMQVFMTTEAMNSFKRGVNRRSGGDLGSKIGGHDVTELTVPSAARYFSKFPIEINYDFTEYVDETTGEQLKSKRPKVQLWFPEDFRKTEPTVKITF